MFQLPEHPQSIGKVLDSGIKLFTASFSRIIPISLAAGIIGVLPNLMFPQLQSQNPEEIAKIIRSFLIFLPVFIVLSMWIYTTLVYRMGAVMYGWDSGLGTSLGMGLKKMLPLLVAGILFILIIALGMVALVIPGLILMLTLFFYIPALVLDNDSIIGSLKHSHRLVWGNWWRTAAVLTIPLLIFLALGVLAGLGVGVAVAMSGGNVSEQQVLLYANLFNILIAALVTPLFYAVMLVQYHDLKLRKEGGDLEQRLAEQPLPLKKKLIA